ncbi:hypothetical protein HDV00_011548 [Rhizophlyctis rosea]|nr:hypothetical protein HDV00_011548 [Rhizophlyctis rosea]
MEFIDGAVEFRTTWSSYNEPVTRYLSPITDCTQMNVVTAALVSCHYTYGELKTVTDYKTEITDALPTMVVTSSCFVPGWAGGLQARQVAPPPGTQVCTEGGGVCTSCQPCEAMPVTTTQPPVPDITPPPACDASLVIPEIEGTVYFTHASSQTAAETDCWNGNIYYGTQYDCDYVGIEGYSTQVQQMVRDKTETMTLTYSTETCVGEFDGWGARVCSWYCEQRSCGGCAPTNWPETTSVEVPTSTTVFTTDTSSSTIAVEETSRVSSLPERTTDVVETATMATLPESTTQLTTSTSPSPESTSEILETTTTSLPPSPSPSSSTTTQNTSSPTTTTAAVPPSGSTPVEVPPVTTTSAASPIIAPITTTTSTVPVTSTVATSPVGLPVITTTLSSTGRTITRGVRSTTSPRSTSTTTTSRTTTTTIPPVVAPIIRPPTTTTTSTTVSPLLPPPIAPVLADPPPAAAPQSGTDQNNPPSDGTNIPPPPPDNQPANSNNQAPPTTGGGAPADGGGQADGKGDTNDSSINHEAGSVTTNFQTIYTLVAIITAALALIAINSGEGYKSGTEVAVGDQLFGDGGGGGGGGDGEMRSVAGLGLHREGAEFESFGAGLAAAGGLAVGGSAAGGMKGGNRYGRDLGMVDEHMMTNGEEYPVGNGFAAGGPTPAPYVSSSSSSAQSPVQSMGGGLIGARTGNNARNHRNDPSADPPSPSSSSFTEPRSRIFNSFKAILHKFNTHELYLSINLAFQRSYRVPSWARSSAVAYISGMYGGTLCLANEGDVWGLKIDARRSPLKRMAEKLGAGTWHNLQVGATAISTGFLLLLHWISCARSEEARLGRRKCEMFGPELFGVHVLTLGISWMTAMPYLRPLVHAIYLSPPSKTVPYSERKHFLRWVIMFHRVAVVGLLIGGPVLVWPYAGEGVKGILMRVTAVLGVVSGVGQMFTPVWKSRLLLGAIAAVEAVYFGGLVYLIAAWIVDNRQYLTLGF